MGVSGCRAGRGTAKGARDVAEEGSQDEHRSESAR